MEEFEIKRSKLKEIDGGGLERIVKNVFGEYTAEGEKFVVRYGAMQPLKAWLSGGRLCVEIVTDRNVDDQTALSSISLRNKFLEAATGYTAKERLKKLKKQG